MGLPPMMQQQLPIQALWFFIAWRFWPRVLSERPLGDWAVGDQENYSPRVVNKTSRKNWSTAKRSGTIGR